MAWCSAKQRIRLHGAVLSKKRRDGFTFTFTITFTFVITFTITFQYSKK